jgi:signal transduction histidine kinase
MLFRDLMTIVLVVSSLLYFLVAGFAFTRRYFREGVIHSLSLYAAGAGVASLFQLARHLGWLNFLSEALLVRTPSYSAALLAFLLLDLSQSFLRLEKLSRRRRGLGLASLVAIILLDSLPLAPNLAAGPGWVIPRQAVTLSALTVVWGIYTGLATFSILKTYRARQQPLHRNRMIYWSTVLGLIVFGEALNFAGQEALGRSLQVVATLIAAYAVLTHSLLDVPRMTRRLLSYVLITLLTTVIFVAGFSAADFVLRAMPGYNPWLIGAALALFAAVLFNPSLSLIRRLVYRLISGSGYDSSRLLSDYSNSISNILELERLSTLVIDLINETMGVHSGLLFLVDEKEEPSHPTFQLRSLPRAEAAAPPLGKLLAESPITGYLRAERAPLTQYDIDLLPRFQKAPPEEHAWFSSLNLDVYVPIYAKNKWIGLLALGPKLSGDRYHGDDLRLLSTLADQTAVALENARLVTDLVKLNDDLRSAYARLDQANQQLAHLDRAKSQFIAIISHELRTPLTLLLGYGQLLAEDPKITGNPDYRKVAEGIHHGSQRLNEIVESMLEVTKIDSQLFKVNAAPVALSLLIDQTCKALEDSIGERALKVEKQDDLRKLPMIEADPAALSKVFYHLIINAIKYTPDGGRITISGNFLSGQSGQPEEFEEAYLELVVSDTGIGIDPRFHELIFTKFYQTGEVALHSTGKTKFKGGGPGLGLAIVRGIVEVHGGKVWVESPGYNEQACPGSHFHVLLPVRQQPAKRLGYSE